MIKTGDATARGTGFNIEFEQLLESFSAQIAEKRRFIGLMKDFLYEYPKELNLMITLYNMGIHEEIERAVVLNDIFAYRFEKRMVNEMGISKENAAWAVTRWCVIYGKKLKKACDIEMK